ncbi:hypothetical protein SAVIM338S_06905 [Streptomyces avidinii]
MTGVSTSRSSPTSSARSAASGPPAAYTALAVAMA